MAGRVNPKDRIQTQISAQTVTMFMAKDIDENTVFKTQTKKEIGVSRPTSKKDPADPQAIEWVPFVDLPTWTGKKGPKTTTEKGKKKFYKV
jgi:mRNA-decapping enzyme subunit 2